MDHLSVAARVGDRWDQSSDSSATVTSDSSDAVFKALADPSRRLLLDSLFVDAGQTLGELSARLPGSTRFGFMKHLRWIESDAQGFDGPLDQRVYTSRLLGQDHSLVLHGGGNTSVKIRERNIFGDEEDILYVKGSGWDLETIESPGFAPVRLERVLRLATLERLSDPQMVQELRDAMKD